MPKKDLNVLNEASVMPQEAVVKPKIGTEEIRKAMETLSKYKKGKANLEKKIISDEQYWKLRQWERANEKDADRTPATAWLWNCIQSRYSDAMDSFPTCNFVARQEDDKQEAKKLSAIVPVILEQNRYEETYSDTVWYGLKHGGWCQGVFWNKDKHNGLGDIDIKKVDFLNLFWESGITDIQDSENLFCVELVSNDILKQRYPEVEGHLQSKNINVEKYVYDDAVDVENKSVVVDWYYKTEYNGRKALHYVKFVEDVVLYATENDTKVPTQTIMGPDGLPLEVPAGEPMSVRGLYDHAMYPFVAEALYPVEGSLCGYGLTDIGRDTQMQIDVLNKAVMDNATVASEPQYFYKDGCGLNEEEFLDIHRPLKKVSGNLQDNLLPISVQPLNGIYVEVLNNKIEELKHVTSNQDVGNGGAPSGITAASAIAALQETQGKNARSSNKAFYRAYRDVVYQVVELIRQFYDVARVFRIAPSATQLQEQYIVFDNAGIRPQEQIVAGQDYGLRKPEFDIEVTAEKSSPYKKMEQNELALSFYSAGFFNPQNADQALACLQMMDFPHKEDIMMRIQQNGTIQQMLLQFQQIALQLAQQVGDEALVENLSQAVLQSAGQTAPSGMIMPDESASGEHPYVERARSEARNSTQVD